MPPTWAPLEKRDSPSLTPSSLLSLSSFHSYSHWGQCALQVWGGSEFSFSAVFFCFCCFLLFLVFAFCISNFCFCILHFVFLHFALYFSAFLNFLVLSFNTILHYFCILHAVCVLHFVFCLFWFSPFCIISIFWLLCILSTSFHA